jgi:hypothetical protein
MVDPDTFVTHLYVLVDDWCKTHAPAVVHPGPPASLSRSEVITLALYSQFRHFESERGFYRHARRHLVASFPTLPDRSQFNRLVRRETETSTRLALALADLLVPGDLPFEILDGMAARTRHSSRRGHGWLAGQATRGKSRRLGWYTGFHVLTCAAPDGVITGFGFAPGSTNERRLAETFFAVRQEPDPRLPSPGRTRSSTYLADTGFWGPQRQQTWQEHFGVTVLAPPEQKTRWHWPKQVRRWFAHHRQTIESIHNRLIHPFRLDLERPHHLTGFTARLAAKVGLHNFCIYLCRQLGLPPLSYAAIIDW